MKIIILFMFLICGTITLYGQVRRDYKNKKVNTYNSQSTIDKHSSCDTKAYCPVCGKCLFNGRTNKHGKCDMKYWTYDYVCEEHKKVVSFPFSETPDNRNKTNSNKKRDYEETSRYKVHEVRNSCFRKDSTITNFGVTYTITNVCKETLYIYIESLKLGCILPYQQTSPPINCPNPPILLRLTHNENAWKRWTPSGTPVL